MPNFTKVSLADTGTTGNNTGSGVYVGAGWDDVVIQFVVEAIGATPTVTWKVQGSIDNTNWYDHLYVTDSTSAAGTATRVATAVGAQLAYGLRPYQYFRLVTTANTNVTYRGELYLV